MHSDYKKVKIVATLGRDADRKRILKLAERGVDVFRNNMSHASQEELVARVRAIRAAERAVGRPLAALGDLMGPKIRIGNVEPGITLEQDARIRLVGGSVYGTKDRISLNFPTILKNIKQGSEIFLGDSDIKLEVERVQTDAIICRVIVGGDLRSRMGFSCHGLIFNKAVLGAKDKKDIQTLLKVGIDIIAMSFVQTARDIEDVIKHLPKGKRPLVIAKIETLAAVQNAEKILEVADGLMVARGDLGFSVPMAEIPFIQKDLIRLGLRKGKPVITATQMLESMIRSHLPTRAEVADVTKAVLDGTDAVMLSGETALGKFPEEAVKTMAKIIHTAAPKITPREFPDDGSPADAVSASVVRIADQINAPLIIVLTVSGETARRIARHRPHQPILALCTNDKTVRDLALTWGVHPIKVSLAKHLEHALVLARQAAMKNPIMNLKRGQSYVVSAGVPFGKTGTTNLALAQRL